MAKPQPMPMPVPAEVTQGTWDEQADKLANALVTATSDKQATWLTTLRDSKGSVYTEALARAIPRLQSRPQEEARDALAQRLTRMTAETLRRLLADRNPELRRGAASACALKGDDAHLSDLIPMLADRDVAVASTVKASLMKLTGQDFGPARFGDPIHIARAIADWQRWRQLNR